MTEKRVLPYVDSYSLRAKEGYDTSLLKFDKTTESFSVVDKDSDTEFIYNVDNYAGGGESVDFNALIFKPLENISYVSIKKTFDIESKLSSVEAIVDQYEGTVSPEKIISLLKNYFLFDNIKVTFKKESYSQTELKVAQDNNPNVGCGDMFLANFDIAAFDLLK